MGKLMKTEKGFKFVGGFSTSNKEDMNELRKAHPLKEVSKLEKAIVKEEKKEETKKVKRGRKK